MIEKDDLDVERAEAEAVAAINKLLLHADLSIKDRLIRPFIA